MLIVEQYVSQALALADTVYILNQGQVEHVGDPHALNQSALIESYLGGHARKQASGRSPIYLAERSVARATGIHSAPFEINTPYIRSPGGPK